jgi:hypothetical protein
MIQVPGITACLLESGASNKIAVDRKALFNFLTTVSFDRGRAASVRGSLFE